MAKKTPLDESQLHAAIKQQIQTATGYIGGEIAEDRRRLLERYYGEPIGNEIEGRSQVQSSDVQDVVEALMPEIMQIFAAGEDVVEFNPSEASDEEYAEQATEYINWIWKRDNDGFTIMHDWFKDALLQINGFIKVVWEDSEETKEEKFTGLTETEVAILADEDGVEVAESDERQEEMIDPASGVPVAITVYDITITRKVEKGRVRIYNVPPEEMLISRRARSLEEADFLAHQVDTTEGELIAEGFDPEMVRKLPTDDGSEFNEEEVGRFQRDDEYPYDGQYADRSMRPVRRYECYVKLDADGDGIAEMRKITALGPAYQVAENEPVAEHPFVTVTPIRMPHKVFGRAPSEQVESIQLLKTTLWRQLLDNAYNVNNARMAISSKVNIEDVLTNRLAAPIRVETDAADVAGHIVPSQTPPLANQLFPVLEYADTVRETRTGVTRYSQGLDADSLNKTATGINQILGKSQQRVLLMAQVFAVGLKEAMKKTLRTVIRHQDRERVIRLRNKWVQIDPRSWHSDMDVTVNVGLGHGTHEQKVMALQLILQMQEKIVQYQGGASGPLINLNHIRNSAAKFIEQSGMPSADPFIADITDEEAQAMSQQQGQQPDPEAMKVQAEMQMKAQQAQAELQMKGQMAQAEAQRKNEEAMMSHQRDMQKLQMEAEFKRAELELKRQVAESELALNRDKAIAHDQIDQIRTQGNLAIKEQIAAIDARIKEIDAQVRIALAARQ